MVRAGGERLEHVLWIGGGCGAGKTTIALELAHRLDLQVYPVDGHGYDLERRLGRVRRQSHDDLWLKPAPEELAERFVAASAEKMPLILDDLRAMGGGPLVLAEGPQLFPDLVAAHVASPEHGVWLVPNQEFQEWALRRRGGMSSPPSDAQRALRNRLARDSILNSLIRDQAVERGLTVLEVDRARSLDEMTEAVAAYFGALIAAGPRALDGAERRRIRRAENLVASAQITAWRADAGLPEAPRFPFVCECANLGCRETVLLSADEYGRAVEDPSRALIAPSHPRETLEVPS